MKKHANEPWRVSNNEFDGNAILGADGNEICWAYHEDFGAMIEAIDPENARRIVACVNACAGIPTDGLEKTRLGKDVLLEIHNLRKQRDELLAALKSTLAVLEDWNGCITEDIAATFTANDEIQQARSAIAKAEGV